MKIRIFVLFFLVISACLAVFSIYSPAEKTVNSEKVHKIGIFQVVRHPVLDKLATVFRSELENKMSGPLEFVTQVADGDPVKTEQMAQQFATGGFDLVFVIGTGQAQSLAKKSKSIPIVLGGATDPVSAGLVSAWDKPGGNITGTSDLSPVGIQLDRLKELLPSASRVGVIFNPLEENSTIIVDLFKTECRKRGLTPVTATVSSQNEIKQTLVSLIGKIDALYAPTDATIQESFSVLSKLGRELRIPVFNCDRSTVENGAVFSVGFNYEELGRVSAEMSWQILAEGKSPADMPIRLADKAHLFYSSEQINYFGLSVPETWKQVGESVPK